MGHSESYDGFGSVKILNYFEPIYCPRFSHTKFMKIFCLQLYYLPLIKTNNLIQLKYGKYFAEIQLLPPRIITSCQVYRIEINNFFHVNEKHFAENTCGSLLPDTDYLITITSLEKQRGIFHMINE